MKRLLYSVLILGWIPTRRAVPGKDRIAFDIGLAEGATLPR